MDHDDKIELYAFIALLVFVLLLVTSPIWLIILLIIAL
jgi:hypothetical protein